MATLLNRGNGRRAIQFENLDGRRKTLGLGKCPAKTADAIKTKVEAILASRFAQESFDPETARWIATLADSLHERLAEYGLVESRQARNKSAVLTLSDFLAQFIAGRSDKAEGTLIHYRQARGLLLEFFGVDTRPADITPHDADQFRSWLKGTRKTASNKPMAENTVRGHLKNAKLIFGAAVKARLIAENPFKGISSQLVKRPDRMAFIEGATIQRILDACPTTRWKAIVVLCRYAGLRCPSEVFSLRWADIELDAGRMRVRSPKGENFGKGIREVPLFPEVRRVLEEFYLEPDGGEFVITTNNRSSAKNLRTMFEKILRKAGVDPWPRLMQNLRSSRETELANEYPIQTVTAWLGNTPKVALENYLQVRDEDFTKAIGPRPQTESLNSAAPALRNTSETPRKTPHGSEAENEKPLVSQAKPTKQGVFKTHRVPPLGLEPRT